MKNYQKPIAEFIEIAVDEEIMVVGASGSTGENDGSIDLT